MATATPAASVFHEVPIGDRLGGDGLLDEAEEQLPTVARTSAVESKRELVQVVVEMRLRHRPLMGAEQPAFEQRDDAVHPWKLGDRQVGVALKQRDAMPIAVCFQAVVPMPAVGVHHTAGLDGLLDEGPEAVGRTIGGYGACGHAPSRAQRPLRPRR